MFANRDFGDDDVASANGNVVETSAGLQQAAAQTAASGRAAAASAPAVAELAKLVSIGFKPIQVDPKSNDRLDSACKDETSCDRIKPLLSDMILSEDDETGEHSLDEATKNLVIAHVKTCSHCFDWSLTLADAVYSMGNGQTEDDEDDMIE